MNAPAPANHNRDAVIKDWTDAQRNAAEWKKFEAQKRSEALAAIFGRVKPGSNSEDIGYGWTARAYKGTEYTVLKNGAGDYSYIPAILAQLPESTWNTLIRWEAKLNVEVYNSLTEQEKQIANQFIQMKYSSVQLELKGPTNNAG